MNTEKIFDILVSEDDNLVLNTVKELSHEDVNRQVLSYLLNLHYFHRKVKVRRAAESLLIQYAPPCLINQIRENWKLKYLRHQEYHHKELYEHPSIDSGEFLVFSQATRRNWFLVKPKKGMIPYASMRYGDEIENIFDCYQVQIEHLSKNILKLQHITVANFSQQYKLDFTECIEILKGLEKLRFLQIRDSNIVKLPDNLNQLSKLKTLVLDVNPIDTLDNYKSETLEKLDIRRTNIRKLDLSNFPNLKELWIDDKKMLYSMNIKNKKGTVKVTSGQYYQEII
jgi:hypothetical protein